MTPAFRRALITWYARHARALPWRSRPTPYRVWVSEIMLQQTRVEVVRDYFTRFLKRFPGLRSLAAADEEEVLQAWSGLGYYRRARMLHGAAKVILEQHRGRFPSERAELLALPGVGLYTAGAILSIAFNRPEPIVDGNVERVFARVEALAENVKTGPGRASIVESASRHVRQGAAEGHEPSQLNQALMELGATVCKPAPDCAACPVRRWCAGRRAGTAQNLPVLPARARAERRRYLFAAITDGGGRLLFVRRPAGDRTSPLPSGMWELPHAEWRRTRRESLESIARAVGAELEPRGRAATRAHSIMNFHLSMQVQPCSSTAVHARGRWLTPQQARQAAIASATRKLLDALER
jgi:A/G-specific adenine glycosylase